MAMAMAFCTVQTREGMRKRRRDGGEEKARVYLPSKVFLFYLGDGGKEGVVRGSIKTSSYYTIRVMYVGRKVRKGKM